MVFFIMALVKTRWHQLIHDKQDHANEEDG
jgi:hypothetical protein